MTCPFPIAPGNKLFIPHTLDADHLSLLAIHSARANTHFLIKHVQPVGLVSNINQLITRLPISVDLVAL